VAALETVRLSLLRLHAGSGTVESLTTDLGIAFEAAKEVDLLLEARREVDAGLQDAKAPRRQDAKTPRRQDAKD
jgi:hypothetical protein